MSTVIPCRKRLLHFTGQFVSTMACFIQRLQADGVCDDGAGAILNFRRWVFRLGAPYMLAHLQLQMMWWMLYLPVIGNAASCKATPTVLRSLDR